MNGFHAVLAIVALVCLTVALCCGAALAPDTPAAQAKDAALKAGGPGQAVPAWPPRLPAWAPDKPQLGAANLRLFMEEGERRIEFAVKDAKPGYGLMLLTAVAFSGDRFVGCHQRFEEFAQENRDCKITIPDLPQGTTKLVVRYQSFAFGRKQWPRKRFSQWYSATWCRFTTAVPRENWHWRFDRGPIDLDLKRWLTDSGARFTPQTRAVKAFTKADLSKQG